MVCMCARVGVSVPVCVRVRVSVSLSTGGQFLIVTLLFHNFLSFYFSLHLTFFVLTFEKEDSLCLVVPSVLLSPSSSTCE